MRSMSVARRIRRGGRLPRGSEPDVIEVEIPPIFVERVNAIGVALVALVGKVKGGLTPGDLVAEQSELITMAAETLGMDFDDVYELLLKFLRTGGNEHEGGLFGWLAEGQRTLPAPPTHRASEGRRDSTQPFRIVIRPEAMDEVDRLAALALTMSRTQRAFASRAGELLGISPHEAKARLTACLETGTPAPPEFEQAYREIGGYDGPDPSEVCAAMAELLGTTNEEADALMTLYALDQAETGQSIGLVPWVMERGELIGVTETG
jgi:hypothetical protein